MQNQTGRTGHTALTPALHADESGIAIIYVTMLLPIIVGFALLAVDVGRFTTLNSSLQHGADALALAGAAELDGRPDAIERSEAAMDALITTNKALFSSSAVLVDRGAVTTCYLTELPENDATPISSDDCLETGEDDIADSSVAAKFLQVIVNPENGEYDTIFPATFVGAVSNTVTTNAEAVAGFEAVVCNFTPLFMCNPFEPSSGETSTFADHGLIDHISDVNKRKKSIRFLAVATGQTSTAVPGQFGFLDPATGQGKNALGEEIASVSPGLCYKRNKVDTKSGSMSDLRNAFNTRFGLYFGSYKDDDYPPARNVRKGYIARKNSGAEGDACNINEYELYTDHATEPGPVAMSVDSCFGDSSCDLGVVGDGDWGWDPELAQPITFEQYWERNFPGVDRPSPFDLGLGDSTTPYSNSNTPPRYDLYKYESTVEAGGVKLADMVSVEVGSPQLGEEPAKSCSAENAVEVPDRRIVYGAIINCRAESLVPGNGEYTAVTFGKFFMIRPMPTTNESELWLELIDVVEPGDGTGVARDMVQLYR